MKSGLSKLIDYAMNPSKTTADKIFNDGMKNEKSEPDIENKIDQILEIEQQQKNKIQNRNRGYSRDER